MNNDNLQNLFQSLKRRPQFSSLTFEQFKTDMQNPVERMNLYNSLQRVPEFPRVSFSEFQTDMGAVYGTKRFDDNITEQDIQRLGSFNVAMPELNLQDKQKGMFMPEQKAEAQLYNPIQRENDMYGLTDDKVKSAKPNIQNDFINQAGQSVKQGHGTEQEATEQSADYLENPYNQAQAEYDLLMNGQRKYGAISKPRLDELFDMLPPEKQYEEWQKNPDMWANRPYIQSIQTRGDRQRSILGDNWFGRAALNAGDYIESLNAGGAGMAGGIAEFMYQKIEKPLYGWMAKDPNSRMIWGRIADMFWADQEYSHSASRSAKDLIYDENGQPRQKQVFDYAKDKDVLGLIDDLIVVGFESAPISVTAMAAAYAGAPHVGMAIIAASSYGQRKRELDISYPDMPEWKKDMIAIPSAGIEVFSERLGSFQIGKTIAKIYSKAGYNAAQIAMRNSADDIIKATIRNIKGSSAGKVVLKSAIEEGPLEEGVAGIGNYILDVAAGLREYDTNKMITEVGQGMAYGAFSGGGFGLIGAPGIIRNRKVAKQLETLKAEYDKANTNLQSALKESGFNFEGETIITRPFNEQQSVMAGVMNAKDLSDIQKSVIENYIEAGNNLNAALVNVGLIDIETLRKKAAAYKSVNEMTNDKSGTIDIITIQGTADAQQYNLKSGKVVRNEDGTINKNKSDESVYYYTGNTNEDGTPEVAVISTDNLNAIESYNPQQELQDRFVEIESEEFVRSEFGEGMQVELSDQNTGATAIGTIVAITPQGLVTEVNGTQITMPFLQAAQTVTTVETAPVETPSAPVTPETAPVAFQPGTIATDAQGNSYRIREIDTQGNYVLEDLDGNMVDRVQPNELQDYGFTDETTEETPINEGSAPVVSGDMTENSPEASPKYPVNKKGEIDFDAMTVAQAYQYMVDNYGQQEAVEALQLQEKNTQAAIQANIKATDKFKNGQYAEVKKATTIQEQLKIREKHKATAQKLTDERAVLDAQLAEIRALMPVVEQAPAQPEVMAVKGSNVRPEVQFRREQEAKAKEENKIPELSIEEKKADIEKKRIDLRSRKSASKEKFDFFNNIPDGTIIKGNEDAVIVKKKINEKRGTETFELTPIWYNEETEKWEPNISAVKIIEKKGTDYNINAEFPAFMSEDNIKYIFPEESNYDAELAALETTTPEAEQQPVIEVRAKEKNKNIINPWQRRLNNLGDAMTVEDVVLRRIAGGAKFVWTANAPLKGMADELGFANKPGERELRKKLIDNENGMTPQEFAHVIYESGDIDFMPGIDYQDIYNAVLDTLLRVNSATDAMETAERLRDSREFSMNEQTEWDSMTEAEMQYLEEIPDDILESYLGITNFTPEQLDIIQNLQNEYYGTDTTTTETSAVDSTPGIESETATEPRTTEEVSSLIDELAFKSNNADKFIQNLQVGMFDLTSEEINPIIGLSTDNTPEQNISIAKKYYSEAKKRHAKLVEERKQEADNARAEQNVAAIEKLALEQIADMDKLIAASESKPIKNGDTVTYKGKQYTVNGIYVGNKEVDLEDEKGNLIHEEVPVSELNQDQPLKKVKGITVINEEDNGKTLIYGTKSVQTKLSVKKYTAQEIKEELDFEIKKRNDALAELQENEKLLSITPIGKDYEGLKKLISDNKKLIESTKVTIPWLEQKLKEATENQSSGNKLPEQDLSVLNDAKTQLDNALKTINAKDLDKVKVGVGISAMNFARKFVKTPDTNKHLYDAIYNYYFDTVSNYQLPEQAEAKPEVKNETIAIKSTSKNITENIISHFGKENIDFDKTSKNLSKIVLKDGTKYQIVDIEMTKAGAKNPVYLKVSEFETSPIPTTLQPDNSEKLPETQTKQPEKQDNTVSEIPKSEQKSEPGNVTSSDKMFSASSRFKPSEVITFDNPIVGPNGNKLISYRWAYEWTMQPNFEGELKGKRVSDWTQAEQSAETGRDLVHQFTVEKTDGTVVTVSSETVPQLLGYVDKTQTSTVGNLVTATKTLAKQKMQLAIMEAQKAEYDAAVEYYSKQEHPKVELATGDRIAFSQRNNENSSHTRFIMGDVFEDQSNRIGRDMKYIKNDIPSKETIELLTEAWNKKQAENDGLKIPYGIYDLRNRVARQEAKVKAIEIKNTQPKVKDVVSEVKPSISEQAKQPWEMTREEYYGNNSIGEKRIKHKYDDEVRDNGATFKYKVITINGIKYIAIDTPSPGWRGKNGHAYEIIDALGNQVLGFYNKIKQQYSSLPYNVKSLKEFIDRFTTISENEDYTVRDTYYIEKGDIIKQALSEGKQVPENVLADYPELKKEKESPELPKGFRYLTEEEAKKIYHHTGEKALANDLYSNFSDVSRAQNRYEEYGLKKNITIQGREVEATLWYDGKNNDQPRLSYQYTDSKGNVVKQTLLLSGKKLLNGGGFQFNKVNVKSEVIQEVKPEVKKSALRKQFDELKAKHQDVIFLFKSPNGVLSFNEDAEFLSENFGLKATKSVQFENTVMFDSNMTDDYIKRIVNLGKKVGVIDDLGTKPTPEPTKPKEAVTNKILKQQEVKFEEKQDWRDTYYESDDFKKADILEALSDKKSNDKELLEIIDEAIKLGIKSERILYNVSQNKSASKDVSEKATAGLIYAQNKRLIEETNNKSHVEAYNVGVIVGKQLKEAGVSKNNKGNSERSIINPANVMSYLDGLFDGYSGKKDNTPNSEANKQEKGAQKSIIDLANEAVAKEEEKSREKIEDYGEKIEGARKDQIRKYYNKINLNGTTLSTIFPKPNIEELLADGLTLEQASAIKVAYEFALYDKKHKKNRSDYAEGLRFYAAYAKTVLSENLNIEFKNERYVFTDYGKSQIQLRVAAYRQIAETLGKEYLNLDLSKVQIRELTGKESKWAVNPIDTKFKYEVKYYVNAGKHFETLEQALNEFTEQVKNNTTTETIEYKRKLNVYYSRANRTDHYIGYQPKGKPFIKLKDGFKSGKEAFDYLKEHQADLQAMLERILEETKGETKRTVTRLKYTNETARERVGKDWRNGKNVNSEDFAKTFGFRGVEYGNWVNQKERQIFLNNAYDSLMDMAQILGISPKAISLNGKLAVSFGSRGSGNASAHYEPERTIINLTKTKGLGSLAHEWFHGVDNYFAGFGVTSRGMKAATSKNYKEGLRPEVQQAFKALDEAFKGEYSRRSRLLDSTKNKAYFSLTHEMAAMAFENYILNKLNQSGQINDFLANYVSDENWNGDAAHYPYPIGEESVKIQEAFDNLFEVIQEDENGVLFQTTDKLIEPATEQEVAETVEQLLKTGLAKEVRMVSPEEIAGMLDGAETLLRTPTGTIYGFVKNGIVYINSNTPNLNTPIHEFGHLWIDAIEGSDLYNRGAELVKETPYWERVNADPNYSHLSENARAKEAMVMAIGDKGEAVVKNKGIFAKLKSWIYDVWKAIGAQFGIKNLTPQQIEKLTFSQFTDIAVSELLSGEKLAPQPPKVGAIPATIDVDGIQRPTTNSTGKLIHSTEEGIRNFWRWFGGKPDSDFTEIQNELLAASLFKSEIELADSIINSLKSHSGNISYFRQSRAVVDHILNNTIESDMRMLLTNVQSIISNDPQVLNSIVEFIPVDVMNNLRSKKITPDIVLNDKSMLQNLLSIEGNSTIPFGRDIANSIIRCVAFSTTKPTSTLGFGESYANSTVLTGESNPILSTLPTTKELFTAVYPVVMDIKLDTAPRTLDTNHNKLFNFITKISVLGIESKLTAEKVINNIEKTTSKVVDNEGRPLVVYHGTAKKFDNFDSSIENDTEQYNDKFIYFTTHEDVAENYAIFRRLVVFSENNNLKLNDNYSFEKNYYDYENEIKEYAKEEWNTTDEEIEEWNYSEFSEMAERYFDDWMNKELNLEIMQVYLSIINPYIEENEIDASDREESIIDFSDKFEKNKYDGAWFKNIQDSKWIDRKYSSTIIATSPNQIKSATGNNGDFSTENNDINFQIIGEQGASNLDAAEEATIRLDNLRVAKEMEKGKNNPFGAIKLANIKEDYDLTEDDEWKFGYDLMEALGRNNILARYDYMRKGDVIIRVKNHTPNWDNFIEDVEEYGAKAILNITVGDYNNSDYSRYKSTKDNFESRYPDVKIIDITVDDGESLSSVIDALKTDLEIANAKAEQYTSAEIRLATGWERGVDGLWRYEVPDGKFKDGFSPMFDLKSEQKLSDIWDDKELFEAYPNLKDIKVKQDQSIISGGYYGVYNYKDNSITLNLLSVFSETDGKTEDYGNNLIKSTLIHEIQHAIQEIEGFAKGGNVAQFERNESKDNEMLKDYSDAVVKYGETEEGKAALAERDAIFEKKIIGEITADEMENQISDLSLKYPNFNQFLFNNSMVDRIRKAKRLTAQETYNNLSGEVEARNASARMNMTEEERRNTLLAETADVAPEDQIILKPEYSDSKSIMQFAQEVNDYNHTEGARNKSAEIKAELERTHPRPTKSEGESIAEYAQRVSDWAYARTMAKAMLEEEADIDETTPEAVKKSKEINAEMLRAELDNNLGGFFGRVVEGWQDNIRSVRIFQELLRKNGTRISDFNNFYMQYTALQGKNDAHLKDFGKNQMQKVNDVLVAIQDKTEHTFRDIENYVFLKHGMERNEYMRNSAAEEAVDKRLPKLTRKQIEEDIDGALQDEYKAAHDQFMEEELEKVAGKDFAGAYAVAAELYAKQNGIPFSPDKKGEVEKIMKQKAFQATKEQIIEDYINTFEQTIEDAAIPVAKLWEAVNGATNYSLDRLVESGLESKEFIDQIKARYKYYVPLRGHEVEAEKIWQYEEPDNRNTVSRAIIKALGRVTRAEHPFAYIIQQAQTSINKANRNTLNQTLLRLARTDKTGLLTVNEAWYIKTGIDPDTGKDIWTEAEPLYTEDHTITAEEIRAWDAKMKELEEKGEARRFRTKLDVGGIFIKPKQKMQHAISVYDNGRLYQVYINGNPRVSQAVNEINKKSVQIPVFTDITRHIATMVTSRSPQFMLSNGTRDFVFASSILPSKEGGAYMAAFIKNYPKAMAALANSETFDFGSDKAKLKQYLKEFEMNGGETGFSHLLEVRDIQKELKKKLKGKNYLNPITDLGVMIDAIDRGNRVIENATRFAVYLTSRENGRSVERAVNDAKEVTLNFNRHGSGAMGAKFIKPFFMFANAGIQALANFGHVYKTNPVKMSITVGLYGAMGYLTPLLIGLIGGDDEKEEYNNMSEWERQNNLCIPTGSGFVKIPLPQELRIFYRLGDQVSQLVNGRTEMAEAAMETLKSVADLIPISPLGTISGGQVTNWKDVGRIIAPDAVAPISQLSTNTNFMGTSIYDPYKYTNKEMPGYMQARLNRVGEPRAPKSVYDFAKWINDITGGDKATAGKLSPNPDVMYHLGRSYFGGIFNLIVDGGDIITRRFYTSKDDIQERSSTISEYYKKTNEAREVLRKQKVYQEQVQKNEISEAEYNAKVNLQELEKANTVRNYDNYISKIDGMIKRGEFTAEEQKYYKQKADSLRNIVIDMK